MTVSGSALFDSGELPPVHDHPAVFSRELIGTMAKMLAGCRNVIDPFAGTGRVHAVAARAGVPESVGVEIEPEWANTERYPGPERRQIVGDARGTLTGFDAGSFDAVLTSPAYGNRMADHHEARDKCRRCRGAGCPECRWLGLSRRNTYRHRLGRTLTPGSSGAMQWGDDYRELHRAVWGETARVLAPGGRMILNVSDHIRSGEEIDVCGWHSDTLTDLGLTVAETVAVRTRRQRFGANSALRPVAEQVVLFFKPGAAEPKGQA